MASRVRSRLRSCTRTFQTGVGSVLPPAYPVNKSSNATTRGRFAFAVPQLPRALRICHSKRYSSRGALTQPTRLLLQLCLTAGAEPPANSSYTASQNSHGANPRGVLYVWLVLCTRLDDGLRHPCCSAAKLTAFTAGVGHSIRHKAGCQAQARHRAVPACQACTASTLQGNCARGAIS